MVLLCIEGGDKLNTEGKKLSGAQDGINALLGESRGILAVAKDFAEALIDSNTDPYDVCIQILAALNRRLLYISYKNRPCTSPLWRIM